MTNQTNNKYFKFNLEGYKFETHAELSAFTQIHADKIASKQIELYKSCNIAITKKQLDDINDAYATCVLSLIQSYYSQVHGWKKTEVLNSLGMNKKDVVNCGYGFDCFNIETEDGFFKIPYDILDIRVENMRSNIKTTEDYNNLLDSINEANLIKGRFADVREIQSMYEEEEVVAKPSKKQCKI